MIKRISLLAIVSVLIWACGGNSGESLQEISLLPYEMAINVKVPKDTLITGGSFGDMQEVVIESKDTNSLYKMQIWGMPKDKIDMSAVVADKKAEIEADELSVFVKYLEEAPNGFLYEYKIDDLVGYDFRCFKIQGAKKFEFQALGGITHTEEAARLMFNAVKEK